MSLLIAECKNTGCLTEALLATENKRKHPVFRGSSLSHWFTSSNLRTRQAWLLRRRLTRSISN